MRESVFRSALKKRLLKEGINVLVTEVPTSPGYPDLEIKEHDTSLLFELKIKRSGTRIKHYLSVNQLSWYNNHYAHGNSNLFCIVYMGRNDIIIFRISKHLLSNPESKLIFEDLDYYCRGDYTTTINFIKEIREEYYVFNKKSSD